MSLLLIEDDQGTHEMYCMWVDHVEFAVFHADKCRDGLWPGAAASAALWCRRLRREARAGRRTTLPPAEGRLSYAAYSHSPDDRVRRSADRAEGALTAGCAIVRLKPSLPEGMLADLEALIRGEEIPPLPNEHGQQP